MDVRCKICGQHKATQMTTDGGGNGCPHCGYCRRWQAASIAAYLHGRRLFARWSPPLRPEEHQLQTGLNQSF